VDRARVISGVLAPIVAMGGIGAAAYINRSWWHLTENAISDLGKVGLPYNYVLNVSFVVASALMLFCLSGWRTRGKLETIGLVIFGIGVGFLALIGVFPEGTSPHYFLSWAFFVVSSVGLLVAGVGMELSGDSGMGVFSVALFTALWGIAIWAMRSFKGIAPAELTGALGIITWYYTAMYLKLKEAGERERQ